MTLNRRVKVESVTRRALYCAARREKGKEAANALLAIVLGIRVYYNARK
jgi:hypothetical protein